MISRCANPDCARPFRYLRDGKLFRVELEAREAELAGSAHGVEHFWLCGKCCLTLTLGYDRSRGIVTIPLPQLRRAS